MSEPQESRPSGDAGDDPNPYLQPVPRMWSRAAGVLLLAGTVALTVVIVQATVPQFLGDGPRAPFTSSSLIFVLMLLVAWGFCWQAGWRLVRGRGGEPGALFSWPVWLAIGVMLLTLTALAAGLWLAAGPLGASGLYLLLSMASLGGWCLWLAWQRRGR